jgi:hypothetical protein
LIRREALHVNAAAGIPRSSRSKITVDRPTLFRFVALSILLHIGIVVIFGTTTYSGARREYDFGGAFDVSLRALLEERGSGFRQAPGADSASPGTALLPRAGSSAAPSPRREVTRSPDAGASTPSEVVPPPAPTEPPAAIVAPPIAPPAAEPLKRLNPDAPDEVEKSYVPAVPAPAIEREVAPPVTPPAVPVPRDSPPPAPAERIVPPQIEREIAPATETKPREVPIAPAATPERAPAPRIEAEPAPPIATPAPRIVPPESVVRPEPIVRPDVVSPDVPRDVAPAAAPASPPAARTVPNEIAPRPAERSAPDKAPTTQPLPRTETAPAELPRLRFGAPEPDEDMFKPKRDGGAPSAEPGAAPRLDLDEAKKRAARAVVREGTGSRGLLSVMPPPPERDTKEARPLDKAVKPDCRTAYANMGLLAAVPLVASSIGDGGCRW